MNIEYNESIHNQTHSIYNIIKEELENIYKDEGKKETLNSNIKKLKNLPMMKK